MDDDDKLHDLNDKETEEIQKAQLIVTEASQFIQDGNLQSSKPWRSWQLSLEVTGKAI